MSEPRYTRRAFWIVKIIGLIALVIVIWNVAAEHGRQEILGKKAVKQIISGQPFCVWGEVIYPAVELNTTGKKWTVRIKKEIQGGLFGRLD